MHTRPLAGRLHRLGAALPDPLARVLVRPAGRLAGALAPHVRRVRPPERVARALGVVTPLGWAALGCGLLTWVAARRLGWVEAGMVAAALLVAVAVALLFTLPRGVFKVDVAVEPLRVVVGGVMSGVLRARNVGVRRRVAAAVELPVGADVATFAVRSLGPGAVQEEAFTIPTVRRGVIDVGPARIVRADPLGLARRVIGLTGVQRLYVHPRTTRLEPLGAGFIRDLEGRTTEHLTSSDLAFHALREYTPGDDLRHVHWRSSARLASLAADATLLVRQYVDTRRSRLALVLSTDLAEYGDDDEFELAISALGSIGLRALAEGLGVTVLAGRRELGAGSGQRLLDGLAEIRAGGHGEGVVEAAEAAGRAAPDASVVFLACGRRTSPARIQLASTRLGTDPRVVALRAVTDADVARVPLGSTALLTLGTLSDLPRLLRLEGS
ncbi:MAG: DUF58 domain-containing protein [Kineosporiaceae bacterium]